MAADKFQGSAHKGYRAPVVAERTQNPDLEVITEFTIIRESILLTY